MSDQIGWGPPEPDDSLWINENELKLQEIKEKTKEAFKVICQVITGILCVYIIAIITTFAIGPQPEDKKIPDPTPLSVDLDKLQMVALAHHKRMH